MFGQSEKKEISCGKLRNTKLFEFKPSWLLSIFTSCCTAGISKPCALRCCIFWPANGCWALHLLVKIVLFVISPLCKFLPHFPEKLAKWGKWHIAKCWFTGIFPFLPIFVGKLGKWGKKGENVKKVIFRRANVVAPQRVKLRLVTMYHVVNVYECYWAPFLQTNRVTVDLDELYNTELLLAKNMV